MKTVHTPHLGRDVKLGGRKARRVWGPHLQLGKYLRAAMPDTPASCDYTAQAMASLSNVYDNDTLGCCVIAGLNHVMGVETGNADGGQPVVVTNDQIVKEYGAIGGYVPGDAATDQGCDEKTAFDYYSQQGWSNGTKAAGYLAVDATNRAEVQAAIYLFENVIYGVSLPDGWVNPFPAETASRGTWPALPIRRTDTASWLPGTTRRARRFARGVCSVRSRGRLTRRTRSTPRRAGCSGSSSARTRSARRRARHRTAWTGAVS